MMRGACGGGSRSLLPGQLIFRYRTNDNIIVCDHDMGDWAQCRTYVMVRMQIMGDGLIYLRSDVGDFDGSDLVFDVCVMVTMGV